MAKSRDLLLQEQRMIRLVDFYNGRCAKSTAFKWINEGKLRVYRLGKMTFVDETFDEFVVRQAAQRPSKALQRQLVAKQRDRRPAEPDVADDSIPPTDQGGARKP